MPSGRRPAARTASTTREIIVSRAATTTIRRRAAPSAVTASPITWWSSTTSSSGIAIASLAWKRTAAASSCGSSMRGSSRWRTTICWFETPRRTRRGRLCVLKKSLRASLSAVTSVTSPSAMMPGARSALTARETPSPPTWTAARNCPSRSRPTIPRLLDLPMPKATTRVSVALRVGFSAGRQKADGRRRSGATGLPSALCLLEERARVQVDQLGAREQREQPAERHERRERDALLARVGAVPDDDRDPDHGAEQEGGEQRRDDRHAQVQA